MKKVFRFIMIAGLIATLSAPATIARDGRNGRGRGNNSSTEQTASRGNTKSNSKSGNGHGQRPSQGNSKPGNNHSQRPSQPSANNRPQGNQHGGNQPGKRPQGNIKPGNHLTPKPGNNLKPGNVHQPEFGYNHSPKPAPKPVYGKPAHHTPPPPPANHKYWPTYHRPTPPPRYVYGPKGPSFGSILGMVIGTAFNASLNYLYSNGYNVSGCGSDAIYLNNVNQMNMMWPDAILRYANGLLASSQYIYSTNWNNPNRYWSLYNAFNAQYGYPASVHNNGGTLSASWFGPGGRFVTINYQNGYNSFGAPCYYTTLTFGN